MENILEDGQTDRQTDICLGFVEKNKLWESY